jgi:hypothetical protein
MKTEGVRRWIDPCGVITRRKVAEQAPQGSGRQRRPFAPGPVWGWRAGPISRGCGGPGRCIAASRSYAAAGGSTPVPMAASGRGVAGRTDRSHRWQGWAIAVAGAADQAMGVRKAREQVGCHAPECRPGRGWHSPCGASDPARWAGCVDHSSPRWRWGSHTTSPAALMEVSPPSRFWVSQARWRRASSESGRVMKPNSNQGITPSPRLRPVLISSSITSWPCSPRKVKSCSPRCWLP